MHSITISAPFRVFAGSAIRASSGFPMETPSGISPTARADTCCRFVPMSPTSASASSRTPTTAGIGLTLAWNQGKYDGWVEQKGTTIMAHLNRQDIPFHYALADAFTICDDYHCSLLGPTDPNRYHMWTGWVGNDGNGGGPVLDNAEAGYDW